jgi:prepilin-type N-terminal cleavage/methylation domain-containing protein
MMTPHRRAHGFTLLEMAIVLVVIGLIVGGITVGISLKKQAALQSTVKDVDIYLTAAKQFRDKYFYLPGDFPNATDSWGSAGASCASAGTGTQTANGNGDGKIDSCCEAFRFWQHLNNEGLVPGQYTGLTASGSSVSAKAGSNVPMLAYAGAGILPFYLGVQSGGNNSMPSFQECAASGTITPSLNSFAGNFGNAFILGASGGSMGTNSPAFPPADAKWIDTKMDDGMPGLGKVTAPPTSADSCATSATAATAVYATGKSAACYLYVQFNF